MTSFPLRRLGAFLMLLLLVVAAPARADMTDTTYRLTHDGFKRSYSVSQPSGCTSACPLMLDLHGFLGSGKGQRSDSGQHAQGDQNGYVVVYPDGLHASWNAGEGEFGACCGFALDHGIDDVGFLRRVVARVARDYPIDLDRVYVTGWSNGCAMAQRLGAEASDVFAAVACTGLYLLTPQVSLPRPITVTEIHGLHDEVIPYRHTASWTGAVANATRWAALDGCRGAPVRTFIGTASYRDTITGCDGGTAVSLVSVAHSGHDTYSNKDGVDVARLVWESVRDVRLP